MAMKTDEWKPLPIEPLGSGVTEDMLKSWADAAPSLVGGTVDATVWERDGVFYLKGSARNAFIECGPFTERQRSSPEAMHGPIAWVRFLTRAKEIVLVLLHTLRAERESYSRIIIRQDDQMHQDRAAAAARIQGLLEENARLCADRTARAARIAELESECGALELEVKEASIRAGMNAGTE